MKYYIPTSSLNFNNILSSESISPQSFYAQRGFGYSRWTNVEENNISDVILLYDKPFEFERPISDSEDHPLLIEIESQEEFKIIADGVYFSDHTIYLNPWDCRFIFFDSQHLTIAQSLSDSSLETKMSGLYKNRIVVESFNTRFDYRINSIPNASISEDSIKSDILLNKMKGLLYGYYIGAMLSTSSDNIKKLRILREIQNIFASVLSSEQRLMTQSQKERLSNLFSLLNKQQPLFQKLVEVIGDDNKVNEVLAVLKSFGHKFDEFDPTYLISTLITQDSENNSAMRWVENQIERIESMAKAQRSYLNPESEELITASLSVVAINNQSLTKRQQLFFKTWVNDILSLPKHNGNISTFQSELSDQLTASVREILGDEWEASEERSFLNHLRRHVRGESFTLPWDNGLFSSIAAVITKGDDWNQMLKFMQSKGMFNYKIAFSLYGVLNGFANLSRDFTDILLEDPNRKYIAQVYKEFYGQLLGKEIIGAANADGTSTKIVEQQKLEAQQNQGTPLERIDYPQAPKQPTDKVLAWQNMIRETAQKHIKKNKETLLKSLEAALVENGWKPTSSGAPCAAWKNLQLELVPDFSSRVKAKGVEDNDGKEQAKPKEGFFDKVKRWVTGDETQNEEAAHQIVEQSAKKPGQPRNVSLSMFPILEDISWINECAEKFISDKKARKQFIIDMQWFVGNHSESFFNEKKNIYEKGIYFGREDDNEHVIERLYNYMRNKLMNDSPKMKWLVSLYQQIPINEIINYLKQKFNV